MNPDKNFLNIEHPDTPLFNSLPVNLSERLDLKELVSTYDDETRLSSAHNHEQNNLSLSGVTQLSTSQNHEQNYLSLSEGSQNQNEGEFTVNNIYF